MKKAIRITISVILCVGIVCGYYYYLSNSNGNHAQEEEKETSEVDKILAKDFSKEYPTTPRAVVKWYNRIITAYYSEEYTDEQLEQMADQARMLMDDELLSYNPRDVYLESLKAEKKKLCSPVSVTAMILPMPRWEGITAPMWTLTIFPEKQAITAELMSSLCCVGTRMDTGRFYRFV